MWPRCLRRAHALAAGKVPDPAATSASTLIAVLPAIEPVPVQPTVQVMLTPEVLFGLEPEPQQQWQPQPEPAADPEPSLRDIYARETDSHVATVRDWISKVRGSVPPHVLPEPVYRACHTLSGSSKMAEARHGIRLAEPLNQWLRKSFDSAWVLPAKTSTCSGIA